MFVAQSRDRWTEGGNAGVELAASKRQLTLELLHASAEERELPIFGGDDDLEAGIRLDSNLALLSGP